MKKLLLSMFMLFAFNQISFSQTMGHTCVPPNHCTPPCAVVCNIINETFCDLDFMWGYQGPCGDPLVPAGKVIAQTSLGTPNPLPWQGPCMSFCDGPCECPTLFRVLDNNPGSPNYNQPVDPWGGAIFSCCWSGTYNNIFLDCRGNQVHVEVSVVSGCITFRFHY